VLGLSRSAVMAVLLIIATFLIGSSAYASKKALVIGVNEYQNVRKLVTAVNDAEKIAERLRSLGFDTVLLTDSQAARTNFIVAWQNLLHGLKEGDDLVIFFAGHGVEVQGANYLVPSDSPAADMLLGEDALKHLLIAFPALMDDLNKKPLNAIVWVIDACRDNPFRAAGRTLGGSGGLVNMEGPAGTFVFYSAGFGQTALDRLESDSATEKNSVYTRTLLKLLSQHSDDPVTTMAVTIRPIVRDLARPHDQRPAYYDGMDKPWCFSSCRPNVVQANYQTATRSIFNPTDKDLRLASAQVSDPNTQPAPNLPAPNAVFLGKKSALVNCNSKISDNAPFGCEFLNTLVLNGATLATPESKKAFVGVPISPQTDVNVRKRAPTLEEKIGAVYACVVDSLTPNSKITLSGVLELSYADDIFFWGTLAGESKDCRKAEAKK